MHLRKALAQTANQVEVVVKRQVRVQTADDVKFRGPFRNSFRRASEDLTEREGVRAGGIGRASKGAKLAMRHAHVCRIDVAVDVEVDDLTMALLAHMVRQPAKGQQIVRLEE